MLNYGYIPNTISGDVEELDAYLINEFEQVTKSKGKVIAIIHRTNDDDDKLIVSKDGKYYSDDAIKALTTAGNPAKMINGNKINEMIVTIK